MYNGWAFPSRDDMVNHWSWSQVLPLMPPLLAQASSNGAGLWGLQGPQFKPVKLRPGLSGRLATSPGVAFEEAQEAWRKLPREVKSKMYKINKGELPRSEFDKLPQSQKDIILEYYRATGQNASKANADVVKQLNQHRVDYLTGARPDPPGSIEYFPKR